MTGLIDHPQHYGGDTPYECVKVIEAWEIGEITPTSGFNLGNALKYIARLGKKGDPILRDLQKIQWYVNREVENQIVREKEVAGGDSHVGDHLKYALNTALDRMENEGPSIFPGMDPHAEWTSRPLGWVPEENPKPIFYDTPSNDPIIGTRFMFDREAGHNVPAYEHQSGRISLDGDTTV